MLNFVLQLVLNLYMYMHLHNPHPELIRPLQPAVPPSSYLTLCRVSLSLAVRNVGCRAVERSLSFRCPTCTVGIIHSELKGSYDWCQLRKEKEEREREFTNRHTWDKKEDKVAYRIVSVSSDTGRASYSFHFILLSSVATINSLSPSVLDKFSIAVAQIQDTFFFF